MHLLQEGLGKEAGSEGEAEEDGRGHSAGRRRSRQQAGKGSVKRKGDQGKRNKNSPLILHRRKGEGRLQASVLRWGMGPRPPRLSATNFLSQTGQMVAAFSNGNSGAH